MWKIWANLLLPKALKSFPKSNKSLNVVTLPGIHIWFHLKADKFYFIAATYDAFC